MIPILSVHTLPFIGEVDLATPIFIVFILCIIATVGFELVNGFHDTANAVATVIYTNALKPVYAIPWSGMWNFLGVALGGVAVAMGILNLVPLDHLMVLPVEVGAYMVLSVLLSSIAWNIGTWYLGIPCSSSHTMIGSMIGAGLAFKAYYGGAGVNWHKAEEIGLSLILSPIVGFGLSIFLLFFLKKAFSKTRLFDIPKNDHDKPPILIRLLLITTCMLVSFFHGSNDGQKGVGLFMLILIAFLPGHYAVNHSISNQKISQNIYNTRQVISRIKPGDAVMKVRITELDKALVTTDSLAKNPAAKKNYTFRKQVEKIVAGVNAILKDKNIKLSDNDHKTLEAELKQTDKLTQFAPVWVIAIISTALGIGTMIGWKRIVVTIGEKIGNEHLSYAQGGTAEIVAASTIGLSTGLGLPVSTTHVLSSGIAGAMVASGGTKNLNSRTLRSIALAWVLTLPVAIALAFLFFALFHLFI
ncbi:inorganic phosphate transporter [Mucilaginibacter ginkgonis]|uniref:Phosphate transporter n=1 Tax=Mucilaginibacter ginkgonis TaxID=2682091 RepID=A0A6I4HXN2_9SPHI|nr:inorganic phosphate transporter [Mucilaginibacter ginkgonis]QQL51471.1 inorganic phosphate transporter [Mucilaginibacter ginkgonis]